MTPKQTAWIRLISIAVSTGATAGAVASMGGAKWPYCLVIGVGAAASAVYHALDASPNDLDKPGSIEPMKGK